MREDFEKEDEMESFLKFHQEKQKEAERKALSRGKTVGEDDEDSEDEMKRKDKKKMDTLPPVDHSKISYPPIEKNFYKPPKNPMKPEEIKEFRRSLRMSAFQHILGGSQFPDFLQKSECLGKKTINLPHLLVVLLKTLDLRQGSIQQFKEQAMRYDDYLYF